MVRELNLRRNKISNKGAERLAKFIIDEDNTMCSINLNRNRIQVQGADKLLDAVHSSIRINNIEIGFGNLIPQAMCVSFEQELQANT
jgi:hypothetical protein